MEAKIKIYGQNRKLPSKAFIETTLALLLKLFFIRKIYF